MRIRLQIDAPMLGMAAVKAAAPKSRDPPVTGNPPNQDKGEAVALEQSSSNTPLMPEMAAVKAAAPSSDPPVMIGDSPNQEPGEAMLVVWTPTTHTSTLDQSSSNPSIQMAGTKRKGLDQDGLLDNKANCIEEPEPSLQMAGTKRKGLDQDGLLANKASCIQEPEPEEAVVVWKTTHPMPPRRSKRSRDKKVAAKTPTHIKKKPPPQKKKVQKKPPSSDDNKKNHPGFWSLDEKQT
jgi:hypothetical protein